MTDERKKAEGIIRYHMFMSMGAGAIPIPLADMTAVLALQMDMIKQLAEVYDMDYMDLSGKAFVTSVSGSLAARTAASLVKFIPGVGSIIGAVSMSIMSGASSYAVGKVCVRYFEKNVNLEDIDSETAKKIFAEEFKKGKKVAKEMEKEDIQPENPLAETAPIVEAPQEEEDVFAKLMQLGELRDNNIITEEEFEARKNELMNKL